MTRSVGDNIRGGHRRRAHRGARRGRADHRPRRGGWSRRPTEGSPLLAAHPELAGGASERARGGHRAQRAAGAGGVPGRARGLPARMPARVRASAGCRTARRSTATPSWPRRRSTRRPQALHDHGLARIAAIRAETRGHRPRARLRRRRRPTDVPGDRSREPRHRAGGARRAGAAPGRARAFAAAPRWFGRLPSADCEVRAGRAAPGAGGAARVLLPARAGRLAAGHVLHQHLRARLAAAPPARDHDLPRGDARATTSRSRSRRS